MTAAPEPGVRRTARIRGRALDDALARLRARDGESAPIDLRADAYGHGADEVERRARAHGLTRFVRSADAATGLDAALLLEPYGFHDASAPALSLIGEVIAVKQVPAGTAVSYGYTYRTTGASTLALVGLGYADGVPRAASSRAPVRIGAVVGVVAGRIAMDQLVVDLGSGQASPGDDAVLWDDAETLAAWAAAAERSPESLTAGLGRRIRREWIDG
jgi:alanine racemase